MYPLNKKIESCEVLYLDFVIFIWKYHRSYRFLFSRKQMFKAASPMLTRETEASLSSLKPARPYLLLELPFLSPLRRGSTPCFKVRIESLLLSLAQFPQITPFWLAVFLRETQDWRERVLLLQKHSHGGLIISCQQTNRSNFYSNFLPFFWCVLSTILVGTLLLHMA